MDSALARRDDAPSALAILRTLEEGGLLTATSFDLPSADLSFESYELIGRWLGKVRDTSAWWLAEWLIFGEGIYGERYAQAVDATGRSKHTLQNYAYVASSVARSRRREDVSFSHHAEVAPLEPAVQKEWLARAAAERWPLDVFRDELRAAGLKGSLPQPAWSGRVQAERMAAQQAVLAEVVELAADPDPARVVEVAERARKALAAAPAVPGVGKRMVRCPSCGSEFEESE